MWAEWKTAIFCKWRTQIGFGRLLPVLLMSQVRCASHASALSRSVGVNCIPDEFMTSAVTPQVAETSRGSLIRCPSEMLQHGLVYSYSSQMPNTERVQSIIRRKAARDCIWNNDGKYTHLLYQYIYYKNNYFVCK